MYAQIVIHTHNVREDNQIFIESLKTGKIYSAKKSAQFIFTITDNELKSEPGGDFYAGITENQDKTYCQDAESKSRFKFNYTPPSSSLSKSDIYVHMNQGEKGLYCITFKG